MRRWRCSWRVTAPEPVDIRRMGLALPSQETELMGLRPAARLSKIVLPNLALRCWLRSNRPWRFCPGVSVLAFLPQHDGAGTALFLMD